MNAKVTDDYLKCFLWTVEIDRRYELIITSSSDFAHHPLKGLVAINPSILRIIKGLPFHPFVKKVLNCYNLAPTQLNLNIYQILTCMTMLWQKLYGRDPPTVVVLYFYKFRLNPKCNGWYNLTSPSYLEFTV